MATWYFWNGHLDLLWKNFYLPNFSVSTEAFITLNSLFYLCLLPLVYFILSLIMMRRDARLTKYQSQISQVMFLWFIIGLLEVWLTRQRTPQSFLVCVPPLAYFLNHYLLLTRRKWIAESMLWVLIIGLITVNSLSVRNLTARIDYSAMFVKVDDGPWKAKRILVLDDNIEPYIRNQPSAYFMDWQLSKPVFENPSYENIVLVAQSFKKDAPAIIVDPHNLMEKFWEYLPYLQKKYRKEDANYFAISKR